MLPAQQRLDALDGPGQQIHLRLVVQPELAPHQGAAQPVLELEPLGGAHPHGHGVEVEPVGALLLGAIHRGIGARQQLVDVVDVGRIDRDADAGGGHDIAVAEPDRLPHDVEDAGREARDRAGVAKAVHDHGELVAAEPRHQIALAQSTAQPLARSA